MTNIIKNKKIFTDGGSGSGGGGGGSYVPYSGATGDVDLNNKALTNVKNIGLTSNTVTPTNGYIWYGGTGGGATSGFNFYSDDPLNASNTFNFSNANNYLSLYQDATVNNWLYVKDGSNIALSVDGANTAAYQVNNAGHSWGIAVQTSGSTTPYRWTAADNTNQTASVEQSAFVYAPRSIQYATGAQSKHRTWWIGQQTLKFVAASTATAAALAYVEGPVIAGTNASITTSYGFLVGGLFGVASVGAGVTTAYGGFFNAPTGAGTNYALGISGNFNVLGNILTDTSTGMKIGTATSQKIGIWNATPDVQPTTAIVAAAFVANTSGISNDTATYGGYTGGQIVAALKRVGILA